MALSELSLTLDSGALQQAIADLEALAMALPRRHGPAVRELEREFEAFCEKLDAGDFTAEFVDLGDRCALTVLPPKAMTELLVKARALGVLRP